MKNILLLILICLFVPMGLIAQDKVLVHKDGSILKEFVKDNIHEIRYNDKSLIFSFKYIEELSIIPISDIDSITFEIATLPTTGIVSIDFDGSSVNITNPFEETGVTISETDNQVSVVSTLENITYSITGTTTNGSVDIKSDYDLNVVLEDTDITSLSVPVINISKAVTATFHISNENKLADASTNGKNNAFASKGNIIFEGNGSLEVSANKKNGISSDLGITINNGSIKVLSAVNDAKSMKADGDIVMNGGSLDFTVSGDQSKGLSGKSNITINNGNIAIIASGGTVLEEVGSGYDPSYCSAIKCDGNVTINNGTIRIENTSTNQGGKSISADGNITINGGTLNLSTAGSGETYTNEEGAKDSYSACCIKSDMDIALLGGNITCTSTGKAGKGIAADGTLVVGNSDALDTDLILNVTTSGERFYVSGSGENADYANPKAVKSEGNLTVNSGTITIRCTQSDEGGEGLESKSTLTINGGTVNIEAYDDCINASNHIEITGGSVYCKSNGNDAIDSNGTLTISGGLVIANGTRAPEAGFDCDQNTFAINGGVIIGTGGSTSNPTASASSQYSVIYSTTAGNAICVKDSEGKEILMFQLPELTGSTGGPGGGGPGGGGPGGNNSSMTVLLSDPSFTTGSYTLYYGGTITGGINENGYVTGGTYSGNTYKSFTISGKVTTVR